MPNTKAVQVLFELLKRTTLSVPEQVAAEAALNQLAKLAEDADKPKDETPKAEPSKE